MPIIVSLAATAAAPVAANMLGYTNPAVSVLTPAGTAQVCFLGYEKWESKDKLHEHFKSDVHKDWMSFVHRNNIASKVCMAVEVNDMSPFDY